MAHKAGVVAFLPPRPVAIGAIIHLHTIPWIFLVSRDVPPPDVNAVPAYPVHLVYWRGVSGGEITMADLALNVRNLYMGDVGKVDAVGLARVHEPWDFLEGLYVLGEKLFLLWILAEGGFQILMTFHTLLHSGDTGKTTILVKEVAFLAFQARA